MSMYVKGHVYDVITATAKNGNLYSIIAIQSSEPDKHGLQMYKLPVYANRANEGLGLAYQALKGQEVLAPFTFSVDNNARISWFLDGLPIKPSDETFAPVRKSSAELIAAAQAARKEQDAAALAAAKAPVPQAAQARA